MLRQILMSVHTLFGLGLAWSTVTGSASTGPAAALPMLLSLGVAWGLAVRRRWVIVPSVILIMLAVALIGMLGLGQVAWTEAVRRQLLAACLVLVVLEAGVIVLGFREFGADDRSTAG